MQYKHMYVEEMPTLSLIKSLFKIPRKLKLERFSFSFPSCNLIFTPAVPV